MFPVFLGYIYSTIRKCLKKITTMCNSLLKMYRQERNETWDPCQDLFSKCKNQNYAVVILNTNFNLPVTFLKNLWSQAKLRVTVDGGTEKWLTWLKLHNLESDKVSPPDLITGDMDSLSKDVLDYFINNNICKVVRTPDQNETDFTKALMEVGKVCASQDLELDAVYVIADTCGRLDQILGNINTLCKATKILKKVKVFQVASKSITWLLLDGTHTIHIPLALRQSHEWCALIPLKSPTYASSSGLKWNLDQSKLEFGGLVSTSNTYDEVSSKVTICTDNTLVWSMGIEALLTTGY
ncbi:thiamin pyrophosphokinase 1 isoform X2 [Zophobas morio]|uniref:thiamin pyrophosphokinase 1 isoform X2 n=1 Tax=Zophobas morio TaxID=2755281 RepID=UPI0030830114